MSSLQPNGLNGPSSVRDFETQGLVVMKPGDDFKMTQIILDEVRDDELLIEMKYSGICHTDVVLQQGLLPMVEFPAIFGHEGAGYIKAIGNGVKNKSLKVGDAVLLSFNVCGECYQCRKGRPAFCHIHPQVNHNAVRLDDRSTPARLREDEKTSVRSQYFGHSSFAKHSVVRERCVVKCEYPDHMPFYAAMGCGFQTGAGTILNVLKPQPDDSVVIYGLGGVGLAAVMAAKFLGVKKLVGVDLLPTKLDLAKQLGASDVINPKETKDVIDEMKKICSENSGATYAIDCTGVLAVIENCIECLAPCGTAVTVGVPPPNAKISVDPLMFLLLNKRYIGVIEGDSVPAEFIPKLVEMHQKGQFPVDKLCKVYPVSKMEDALHDMHGGEVIKPVLEW